MKTRLIFVRHAEAEGNLYREFHGWTDSPITDKGHKQAELAAGRLRNMKIDVIYSSSLKRTLQTAQYIADIKGLPIIRTDKLKEINGGDWEGKKWDELASIWPHENETWEKKPHIHRMPNGESMEEFQERLLKEIQYIIDNNRGKNICIVTHGTAIKAMMCRFKGCELEEMVNIKWYDNTSVTVIDYEDGSYKVVMEGDASHLSREMSTIYNQEWWSQYEKQFEDRQR
ncbi:MAG TPA: histidine phosphatase family protein [Pseudobacteroides sp.]|uniref:histidine phosphatase family protein n=1 Tax=Pseudobacteroides sp. TaxID=1968840 RepID=UPI002F93E38A